MTTVTRVSTNYAERWHVYVDADADTLDCLLVELPPYTLGVPVLVHRVGASMDELWSEALEVLALLRAQPRKLVLPASVLNPFGVISARSFDDVQREAEVKRETALGQCSDREREQLERTGIRHSQQAHEQRVSALCRAWGLMQGAPLPQGSFDWPPVRH